MTKAILLLPMFSALLPYYKIEYQTDLTSSQIEQRLTENVITGFSFYSRKPYYGSFTPYSFSVNKTSSNFKKQGLGPSIEGSYKTSTGKMLVTISVRPHMVWIITFFLVSFPLAMLLIFGIGEFFKTGDIGILFNVLFPIVILYGIFWLIFQAQSRAAIQFWEYTLQLQKLHT